MLQELPLADNTHTLTKKSPGVLDCWVDWNNGICKCIFYCSLCVVCQRKSLEHVTGSWVVLQQICNYERFHWLHPVSAAEVIQSDASVCVCGGGVVRATLCTTLWVQDYVVHHRPVLCMVHKRSHSMTSQYDVTWHHIMHCGAKGLGNLRRGRCVNNAQAFSFIVGTFDWFSVLSFAAKPEWQEI